MNSTFTLISSDAVGIYWQATMGWLLRYGVIFWESAKVRMGLAQSFTFCANSQT
jgi:hypothetical protein